jgi:hypothetical protein
MTMFFIYLYLYQHRLVRPLAEEYQENAITNKAEQELDSPRLNIETMRGKDSYYDVEDQMEPENTVYTLTVLCPAEPRSRWCPSIFKDKSSKYSGSGSTWAIKPDDTNPNRDCFEYKHLEEMERKAFSVKRKHFPVDFRCAHVRHSTTCTEGCYVLERGGKHYRKKCSRKDCEGHVYCGRVTEDKDGVSCFGEKGKRMVCLER